MNNATCLIIPLANRIVKRLCNAEMNGHGRNEYMPSSQSALNFDLEMNVD